jgi:hypothetical protein
MMITQDGEGLTLMRRTLRLLIAAALCGATAVLAQSDAGGWGSRALPYNGQFTFVRLRWRTGRYAAPVRNVGPNFWLHEYPRAEQNLISVIDDVTLINTRTNGSLILGLEDPHLFHYPVAMLWEPGFWLLTDKEAEKLREYLQKGGFLIVNDFEEEQWDNFEGQMRRVWPSAQWIPLDGTHPIFNSFFRVEQIAFPHPRQHHLFGFVPSYFGLFEHNDPRGRMLAIANYNTNLAEYWQMAHTGFFPIDSANEAFKLGVNYMMYTLTH